MNNTRKSTKSEKSKSPSTIATPERLTKDDLKALRTNLKGGGPIPRNCCEAPMQNA